MNPCGMEAFLNDLEKTVSFISVDLSKPESDAEKEGSVAWFGRCFAEGARSAFDFFLFNLRRLKAEGEYCNSKGDFSWENKCGEIERPPLWEDRVLEFFGGGHAGEIKYFDEFIKQLKTAGREIDDLKFIHWIGWNIGSSVMIEYCLSNLRQYLREENQILPQENHREDLCT